MAELLKSNSSIDTSLITDPMKLSNEPLQENVVKQKKRKRQYDLESENKQKEKDEAYNRELQEQQYKRLMHLLNRSKFYASYIVNKINSNAEKDTSKGSKKGVKKSIATDENTPPQDTGKKKVPKNYDIQDYITDDLRKKIDVKRNKLNLSDEDIEQELINDSENGADEATINDDFKAPKYFTGNLRDYQKDGFHWLKVLYENGINGILADEMGLGKTVQVIALLCHLIEKRQDGPYLIIAPLSTIPNWMMEFEKFAPQLPVVLLYGNRDERLIAQGEIRKKHKMPQNYSTQPIVLTSFEVPLFEKSFIKSQNWRYIIIDEGHRIKNYECILIQVLKACKSMNRLLLTGTPLQNNLAELWSLLNFLLPEIFHDLAVFESWFDAKQLDYDEGTKKMLKLEEEKNVLGTLREILKPFMLRREKTDVCLDIPPKKEVVVYAPLTKLQHDLYTAVLNREIHRLSKSDETTLIYPDVDGKRPKRSCVLRNIGNNNFERGMSPSNSGQENDDSSDTEVWKQTKPVDKNNLLIWKQYTNINDRNRNFLVNIQMKHRVPMYKKIVNHPYLVYCPLDASGLPKIDEDLIKSSGKLMVLDAMLAKLKSQGHKVLLFSTMTLILDMIEDYLMLRDYGYVRLDGNIRLEDRKENIKRFNESSDIFLFLISTRAGGVGLNLAAADTVIIYDSDWNPQMDIQAMARCHRIGQNRPVVVYKLCTKGTIDEAIMARAESKRVLEKMVISKKIQGFNMNDKGTLIELRSFLESKECQVVASENEAFTEEELNKLIDRSDLYAIHKKP
ncbi:lymphoid-specific helicase [Andrena cerasifolii]|uniref:lymphoid-specific helicase n=1 Tax=Andrena cerasifolii TaxID=2819439 RepID=UPI004037F714